MPAQMRPCIRDDGQHDHCVGSIKRHVCMRCSDLGSMGQVIDRSQGVQEAPDTGTQKCHHSSPHCPQHGCLVGMIPTPFINHIEGKNGHQEERYRFQCRENRTQPLPVIWRANPEIVMTSAKNTGNQRHGDDQVKPLIDNFAVNTGGLDQHVGQDRCHD